MSEPISDPSVPDRSPAATPAAPPGTHGWTQRERPLRLERRLEFPDYEATRVFLERAGEVSEAMDLYPDLSFGRTYVNLTVFADEESGTLPPEARAFAERIDRCIGRSCSIEFPPP
ncbi:4a-hydroxytetrahydrobiopterin dehydratase [Rhabdochromatium marinum]|uniref:4a-hydroxytetrahydrobiopterin dehydratase n=1 Tax=Rhabdochromatium marinum TaxID=48729 RepID=UPI001905429C|nr:4a-hydroxytetrahydrobiopterin dehydratase [Rhabdochromatium marinum]MBK1647734.1 hypothetical protein [Rhabdochromatium marinum]